MNDIIIDDKKIQTLLTLAHAYPLIGSPFLHPVSW